MNSITLRRSRRNLFKKRNAKIIGYLRELENKNETISIEQLSKELNVSNLHLQKLIDRNILIKHENSNKISISEKFRPIRVIGKKKSLDKNEHALVM